MSRRTQTFTLMPWAGGINTSVDPGVLNAQELVQADNVQFSSTGARIKREAYEYLDQDLPAPTFRSSSGTVRTLKFAADELITTSPVNQKLVVGEKITVTGAASYAATSTPILSITDLGSGIYSITYTGASGSLSESEVAAGNLVIARASTVIAIHDYWYYETGNDNSQILIYATSDFQLFSLDSSGRRAQIHGQVQTTTVVAQAASAITTGDYFLINGPNNVNKYYVWYNKDAGGGDPAIAGRTAIPVAIVAADSDAQVATATQLAIDAVSDLSASVNTATVTVANSEAGLADPVVDGNTGFTFTTTAYGATNPPDEVERIRMLVFNERLHIFFSGLGNYHVIYNPNENDGKYVLPVENRGGGTAGIDMPDASFGFIHLGRIWTNDKNQQDYLHYCETFDETLWLGIGDSGALPINIGDGDPEGILNAYVYKGFIVVAKKQSRHRILGDSPENFVREQISSGMGNEGPLSIPVDETDVVFVSKRGVHSQQATDQYGDTDATFLSADIKPSFNDFDQTKIKNMQGAYIPELNSIALSVKDSSDEFPNAVWLYNFEVEVPGKPSRGAWYRWPDTPCTALSRRLANDQYKLVFGTNTGRIIQAQKTGDFTDFGTTGIPFRIKSGTIYPKNDPHSIKAFKKISLIYRPKGNFAFAVRAKIDNQKVQTFSFNQISGLDLLGTTFILGESTLGSSNTLAPFTFTMEGYGRGVTLEITQASEDEQVEIWGVIIEFEGADLRQSANEDDVAE